MEKFIIRYAKNNCQNDTSTETVGEQANDAEGDDHDGEPKGKNINSGNEGNQTRRKVRKFQSRWFVGRSCLKYDPEKILCHANIVSSLINRKRHLSLSRFINFQTGNITKA